MLTTEQFIEKARKVHGDKYDYSKVEYTNSKTKVCIICPEHGEFWQTPNNHLKGQGCHICGRIKTGDIYRFNINDLIKRFKQIHGDEYRYEKVNYTNMHTNITITCPKHGDFLQTPHNHLKGAGCPECYNERKRGNHAYQEFFLKKAKEVHGNKYDYSNVKYINSRTKVLINCPIHGNFEQTPGNHIDGCGCPKCGVERRSETHYLTTKDFISKARKIHGEKYDYSKSEYVNYETPLIITCPKHGDFLQTPHEHLDGCGCQKCSSQISKPEVEIVEYLTKFENNISKNVRTIINPYELDIYLQDKKIAIEYNGLRWHSEKFSKDKTYHLNKLEMCKKRGIKLIQIFEDEYVCHKEIVLNKLKHILKQDDYVKRIAARKCSINEVDKGTAKTFLEKYHIQGFVRSSIYIGCYLYNELVGVMSFKRETKNSNKWELTRFASNYNYICQGVGGKLFKYFVTKYNPDEVKSFADRRWTVDETNNIYTKLGFKFIKYTKPDYRYYNQKDGLIRQHKFNFRKERLHRKYNLPLTMTESEMVKEINAYKVWDCGMIKYVWYKNKKE